MTPTVRPAWPQAAPTLSPREAKGSAVETATASGDAGFAPLSLVLGLVLLVIPVLLLVLTIPTWIERSVDARDAAANAARALATADTWADGQAAARQAVTEIATNDGISPADIQAGYSGSLVPGGTVTATITVTIPAGVVPGVGHYGTVHYTASSTQHVDSYRGDDG